MRGFNYDTSNDTLMFYFENRKRSGGGETEHVDVNREDGVALVTFKEEGGTYSQTENIQTYLANQPNNALGRLQSYIKCNMTKKDTRIQHNKNK